MLIEFLAIKSRTTSTLFRRNWVLLALTEIWNASGPKYLLRWHWQIPWKYQQYWFWPLTVIRLLTRTSSSIFLTFCSSVWNALCLQHFHELLWTVYTSCKHFFPTNHLKILCIILAVYVMKFHFAATSWLNIHNLTLEKLSNTFWASYKTKCKTESNEWFDVKLVTEGCQLRKNVCAIYP